MYYLIYFAQILLRTFVSTFMKYGSVANFLGIILSSFGIRVLQNSVESILKFCDGLALFLNIWQNSVQPLNLNFSLSEGFLFNNFMPLLQVYSECLCLTEAVLEVCGVLKILIFYVLEQFQVYRKVGQYRFFINPCTLLLHSFSYYQHLALMWYICYNDELVLINYY